MEFSEVSVSVLRLARTPGVGPVTVRKWLARVGSVEEIIRDWAALSRGKAVLCTETAGWRELDALKKRGGTMVVWGTEGYPAALAELPDAPLVLSVLGDAAVLHERQVAVVGNRSASATAMQWTEVCCAELARQVVVTSGLARGIDTAAHGGALRHGRTVAVVAGSVDHIYPPENRDLREKIIASGCVISEQPLGSPPTAMLFPRRNRIIAGLSIGVLVAEASRHSGSLITAECALGYGRDVWAVPGNPMDPRASGPNHLLKQGAQLVEGAADILAALPARPAPYVPRVLQGELFAPSPALSSGVAEEVESYDYDGGGLSPRQKVWSLLGGTPVGFEVMLHQTHLPEGELNMLLTELELDGLAARDALGGWRRA